MILSKAQAKTVHKIGALSLAQLSFRTVPTPGPGPAQFARFNSHPHLPLDNSEILAGQGASISLQFLLSTSTMLAKAYIVLILQVAITIHALPTMPQVDVEAPQLEGPQSEDSRAATQSRNDVQVLQTRGCFLSKLLRSCSPKPAGYAKPRIIETRSPWPIVTTDRKDPATYVVFSHTEPCHTRFRKKVDSSIRNDFFQLPAIKAVLGESKNPPVLMRYPDPIQDRDYVHFSIVGPKACGRDQLGGTKRHIECRALFMAAGHGSYWIKDGFGKLIAFQPSLNLVPSEPDPETLYLVFSSPHQSSDSDAAKKIINKFLLRDSIKKALNLYIFHDKPKPIVGYPDAVFDQEDLIFSIIGPEVCKGQCTAAVNRRRPRVSSIRDAEGILI
ncbi:hypothetical protein F5878DRAFT_662164 [Lentinula raphanica]|uniref:Uncharacterized protein n=1 Tax=Lentinula raphanica TaxID=153919 RepID=A0AA38P753_9AGAR|nr:hypothetical protein F5878DRAFT_662164 [Lentinula raphanica]